MFAVAAATACTVGSVIAAGALGRARLAAGPGGLIARTIGRPRPAPAAPAGPAFFGKPFGPPEALELAALGDATTGATTAAAAAGPTASPPVATPVFVGVAAALAVLGTTLPFGVVGDVSTRGRLIGVLFTATAGVAPGAFAPISIETAINVNGKKSTILVSRA